MTATEAQPAEELQRLAVEIEEAESSAQDADKLAAALEQRVADGDADVTPSEYEEARGLARFARKRAEGARKRQAAAEEAQRTAELEAVDELIRGAIVDAPAADAEITQAREQCLAVIEAALRDFAGTVRDRDSVVETIVQRAHAAGVPTYLPGMQALPVIGELSVRVEGGQKLRRVGRARMLLEFQPAVDERVGSTLRELQK